MPKTKQQKQESLRTFVAQLEDAKSVVFSTFSGMNMDEQEEIRKELRKADIAFFVYKKTLLKRALQSKGLNGDVVDSWTGNIGIAMSKDEVAPARILVKVSKNNDGFKVHYGILEGKEIDEYDVSALAALPSKDELLAKAVGTVCAPLYGLVNVLQGTQRSLLNVLSQIKDKK